MAIPDSRVDEEEQVAEARVQAPTAHESEDEERTDSGSLQVSRGRRLDVDAVLARSLAKVVSE